MHIPCAFFMPTWKPDGTRITPLKWIVGQWHLCKFNIRQFLSCQKVPRSFCGHAWWRRRWTASEEGLNSSAFNKGKVGQCAWGLLCCPTKECVLSAVVVFFWNKGSFKSMYLWIVSARGPIMPLDDASKQAKVCLESPVFYHHWQMAATCAMIVLCTTVHIIIWYYPLKCIRIEFFHF